MMTEGKKSNTPKKILFGRKLSRREIIEAVTEPESVVVIERDANRTIAIPVGSSTNSEVEKMIREMDVVTGSLMHRVVKLFSEEKKTSAINIKVFIQRVKNLNEKQLKLVALLCTKKSFSATSILKAITSIRKYDGAGLLALHAFVELEDIAPGPLNQYFTATLPQKKLKDDGREAYENEIREKMITPDQNNAFYNICHKIDGITPATAISVLKQARKLKPQHAKMINAFINKGALFGEKQIDDTNVLKLLKLWSILPELNNQKKFIKLIKRVSRKTEKRNNFQFIVKSYKNAILRERSGWRFPFELLRFFS